MLLAHNLSDREQKVHLRLDERHAARDLLSRDERAIAHDTIDLSLPAYGYRWFREFIPNGRR